MDDRREGPRPSSSPPINCNRLLTSEAGGQSASPAPCATPRQGRPAHPHPSVHPHPSAA